MNRITISSVIEKPCLNFFLLRIIDIISLSELWVLCQVLLVPTLAYFPMYFLKPPGSIEKPLLSSDPSFGARQWTVPAPLIKIV
jgi:hypothetical protein